MGGRRGSFLATALQVIAMLAGLAGAAGAQAEPGDVVALLPFEAEERLALYGKPVAAEVARALRSAGLEVVLVLAGAPVPGRARLVVDGRLQRGKTGAVDLTVRVRDPKRGIAVASLVARAEALNAIDRAAGEVAARLLVEVRAQLDALTATAPSPVASPKPSPSLPVTRAAQLPPLAVEVSTGRWSLPIDGAALARRLGYRAVPVVEGGAGPALVIDVLGFTTDEGVVPTARARARVVLHLGGRAAFDRVVRTDSLVGDRGSSGHALAAAAAAQLIDIVEPRLRERLSSTR